MLDELRPFLEDLSRGQWRRALTDNRIFRAWFRTGYPSTPRQQALIMFNNVFLHLHPVRIRRESLRITYTFCLGGLSFFLFLLLTITGVLLIVGYEISDNALFRWYVLHVIGMPLLTAVLMAVHFCRIRKDGGISGPL